MNLLTLRHWWLMDTGYTEYYGSQWTFSFLGATLETVRIAQWNQVFRTSTCRSCGCFYFITPSTTLSSAYSKRCPCWQSCQLACSPWCTPRKVLVQPGMYYEQVCIKCLCWRVHENNHRSRRERLRLGNCLTIDRTHRWLTLRSRSKLILTWPIERGQDSSHKATTMSLSLPLFFSPSLFLSLPLSLSLPPPLSSPFSPRSLHVCQVCFVNLKMENCAFIL